MSGRTDDTGLIISLLQDILAVLEEIRADLESPDDDDNEGDEDDAPAGLESAMAETRPGRWAVGEPRGWLVGRTLASFIYVYDDLPTMRH